MKPTLIMALLVIGTPAIAQPPLANSPKNERQRPPQADKRTNGDDVNCFGQDRAGWVATDGNNGRVLSTLGGTNSDANQEWMRVFCEGGAQSPY